jgi:acyl carrier protein
VTLEAQAPTPSQESIVFWLTQWIAKELGLPVETIETSQSLLNYSLSSVTAMMLVGDLEEWLGLTLPPTLVWDYPSIDAIASYLVAEAGGVPAAPASASDVPQEREHRVDSGALANGVASPFPANLDGLSDQQVSALLNQLIAEKDARPGT